MANASAKRIASQNETTIKFLRLGLFIPTLLNILLRLIFRRSSLPPSKTSLFIYIITLIPAFFISQYLIKIGTGRRDSNGAVVSAGEDLTQGGITEWCFDIVYVTWTCQIASGLFGDRAWWLYAVIPAYAVSKAWSSVIQPMFFPGSPSSANGAPTEATEGQQAPTSKRQEKLRKRAEKGDPRVKSQQVTRDTRK